MMIKNLSVSKELDAEAMATLCGGFQDTWAGNYSGDATAVNNTGSSLGTMALAVAAPNQGIYVAPYNYSNPVAVGILGSNALAFA